MRSESEREVGGAAIEGVAVEGVAVGGVAVGGPAPLRALNIIFECIYTFQSVMFSTQG